MADLLEKIVSLAKRRGFIYPSSEIYGGIGGFWDWGPLGVELANNIKNAWWQAMVYEHEEIFGLSSTIIHHPRVWEASGHAASFTDPLRECKSCHLRFRADKLEEKSKVTLRQAQGDTEQSRSIKSQKSKVSCPECDGELAEVKQFNLMFKTSVGSTEETASLTYLRPETCQGIFINFRQVLDSLHPKIPFGMAQIGKAFRNEITTGDFIFRDREFEMMELEYFVKPGQDEKIHEEWIKKRLKWHQEMGLKNERLRLFEHSKESLAHYSRRTVDIEYHFPWGWAELEGIANRGDFDLKNHSRLSGHDLSYQEEGGEKYFPYVIEPSLGVERMMLALLLEAYQEEKERVILSFRPCLAPYKAAVFPLLANKPDLVKMARAIYESLKGRFPVIWDDRGNIGKRYYSQDEIGTPWCFTVDYQSLEDKTVTVRDRQTKKQIRAKADGLSQWLEEKLKK